MKKIPFSIDYRAEIEAGRYKVQTRDGRDVRIICWDRKRIDGRHPIIALVRDGIQREKTMTYSNDGKYICDEFRELDLFIISDEPELNEMESCLLDWLSSDTKGEIPMNAMKECVRLRVIVLLNLARKELEKEYGQELLYVNEKSYSRGVMHGKAEAIKEMPKWGYMGNGSYLVEGERPAFLIRHSYGHYTLSNRIGPETTHIRLTDLEKLPMED